MVDKFETSEITAEFSRKAELEPAVVGYIFYSQLLGTAIHDYEAVLKTSFLFCLDESEDKKEKIYIHKDMTLGQLIYAIKQIFPAEGKMLYDLVDVKLRNTLAHGTFWFDNGKVFLAQNSHPDEVEQLSLADFWKRTRRINIISHAFIETLLAKAKQGYFKP
jgi:hypothetical protein